MLDLFIQPREPVVYTHYAAHKDEPSKRFVHAGDLITFICPDEADVNILLLEIVDNIPRVLIVHMHKDDYMPFHIQPLQHI